MSNTLTNFVSTLYEAMDEVSRELTGLVGGADKNMSGQGIGLNQTVRVPISTARSAGTITPASDVPDAGDETPDYEDILLDKSRYVPIRWEGEEQAKFAGNSASNLDRFMKQQFAQAMRTLVNEMEVDLGLEYVYGSRAYGTAGTTPFASSIGDLAEIKKILDDNGAPMTGRNMVLNTTAGVNLRKLTGITNVADAGSSDPLRRGILLDLFGFKIGESAGIASHTKGAGTGYLINNVSGEVALETILALDGGTVNTTGIKAGDIVTFTGDTNKYVVRTGLTATSGDITINKKGLINTVANDVAMTIGNSYTANLAFHTDALKLVTRLPNRPLGGDRATDVITVTDPISGLTFALAEYKGYHRTVYMMEIVWGVKLVKPEWSAILLG